MIDDSGTGDLLGDAFIVFWRRETNSLIRKAIPLEIYQAPDYNEKSKELVKQLMIEAITELQIPSTEEIYMCPGNIFDECRKYLNEQGFNVFATKIDGYFQEVVEQTYLDHLINDLGVPSNILTVESGKKRFLSLYHWLIEDYPRRNRFVKSGFDKWQTKWDQTAQEDWMRFVVNLEPLPSDTALFFNEDDDQFLKSIQNSENESLNQKGMAQVKTAFNKRKSSGPPRGKNRMNHGFKKSTHPKPNFNKTEGPPKKKTHMPPKKQTEGRLEHPHKKTSESSSERHYSSTNPNPRRRLF
jgi:hypothetical protein